MGYRANVVVQRVPLGEASTNILKNLAIGQAKAGERLLALASAKVPMDDDGTLLQSGTVSQPLQARGEETDVVFDTPYAARWHEDQPLVDSLGRKYQGNSNFQNGRSSHYLSEPAEQNQQELLDIIANEGRI